ncbi:MAG: DUF6273 domain-containing protein [Clostridiales Family XIII bacterium]|jgi:tetratricopeptide (TPR) repeat protein|nr:DUF6273 domain-containing protein [Clostridiales Family XIII bacterium]
MKFRLAHLKAHINDEWEEAEMAILKCKMCGGDIEVQENQTYGTCDSCGSTMTLPNVADDKRANLFNRANHFRRLNDFDKAISSYELILNEDDTDAEAHWGVLLSRYGIEYVEDPVTHLRMPTLHRMQTDSILKDSDYLSAVEYAPDGYTQSLYEQEGRQISDIQKYILSISTQTEPYDVFICYKESSESGTRTKDSVLAQDIYYQLHNSGIKTFYSRITLEDKLGQEYEPYIFAALNSAKIMVVVTTSPENINAVWVRNEWSRFLALMKNDRSKLLIPCYQGIDPYDLPDEMSMLQSQDMSKIGFLQDLIRGIEKVLKVKDAPTVQTPSVSAAAPGVDSLYKRALLFLEDGDWRQADEYFDRILDIDPEYASAYIGKLCAELSVPHESELAGYRESIAENGNFIKAVRFANADQKTEYDGYEKAIQDRLFTEKQEQERKAREIKEAAERQAKEEQEQREREAREMTEAANRRERERLYNTYKQATENGQKARSVFDLKQVVDMFKDCGDYNDSSAQAEHFTILMKKATTKMIAIRTSSAATIIVVILVITQVVVPATNYNKAVALLDSEQYTEAVVAFKALGDYKDSVNKASESEWQAQMQQLSLSVVGSIVTFGDYEWIVLDKAENKLLIITRDIVGKRVYDNSRQSVTWETCTLRKYLNEEFYDKFSAVEKTLITETSVVNAGNDTKDKIFLLSVDEAKEYFDGNDDRNCGDRWWWLRSPGDDGSSLAAFVNHDGSVGDDGVIVISGHGGVRPALWLNLESDIE